MLFYSLVTTLVRTVHVYVYNYVQYLYLCQAELCGVGGEVVGVAESQGVLQEGESQGWLT